MARGMIHRLIDTFTDAAKRMGLRCECAEIERIAVMVHRVMSYQSRQFHTLAHVFGFLEGADPETALAAAFHDLVYYQVDDGLPAELEGLLGPFVAREGKGLRLSTVGSGSEGARAYADCLAVFGFEAGQELKPFGGLNEFLSALAMARSLEGLVPRATVAAIAACIEASIPFRGPDEAGRGPGEALEARLAKLDREGGLGLGEGGVVGIVHRAVAFGNADVRDFALADPGLFLSNTWKLLPESNAPLRRQGAFSIREYRQALGKMLGFFQSLPVDHIYHAYRSLPDEAEMTRLSEAARRNVEFGQAYLQAKLLAVGLLEAAAKVSGGDAPMALFMGDLPHGEGEAEILTSYLPEIPAPSWISTDHPVYRLLKDGRLDESSFDLKNSPLALYLYHRLKPHAWGERSRSSAGYFAGEIDAAEFLAGFDRAFVADFLSACARMVPTRGRALEDALRRLPHA